MTERACTCLSYIKKKVPKVMMIRFDYDEDEIKPIMDKCQELGKTVFIIPLEMLKW